VRATGEIAARLAALRERAERAAMRAGRRPQEVTLLGAAKGQPAASVVEAVRAGLACVGENYVQEALRKRAEVRVALEGLGCKLPSWHFIGKMQRNKARLLVETFDVLETLDRAELGADLERRAAAAGRQLRVLLQVNVSGEPQKGGVAAGGAAELLAASAAWPHLELAGLMAIPAPSADPKQARAAFAALRELRDRLRGAPGGAALRELSMGMSADFEVAIEEGATLVRIGTALFGPRPA
jgi:pyridoxal phosphate enzyme (YggS family)